jgi:leader peptidase (prepilin peptidase) / N-methyltransferase
MSAVPLLPVAVLAAVLGLSVGSFLNVVIYRVPAGLSIVSPPSRCPSCEHPIRNRHNIPVLGWLMLRGKCADCGNPISARYPLVEFLTGALFVAFALDVHRLHWALPAYLYFVAVGVALAMIDIDHKRLPDVIVLPSYPVVAALLAMAAGLDHNWWALARAGIGAAALFGFYFAIAFVYPAGMGFGDVKLSGILAALLAYLSWGTLIVGAFGGFLLGGVGGVVVLAARRGDRKTAIPFGPFMIGATGIAVFIGAQLSHWYLSLTSR